MTEVHFPCNQLAFSFTDACGNFLQRLILPEPEPCSSCCSLINIPGLSLLDRCHLGLLQIDINTSNNDNSISNALIGLFSFDASSISLLGEAVIDKGPTDGVESDGKSTFSCTLNVTSGDDVLRFRVFGTGFTDRLSGCEIDTSSYSRTLCSWPVYGTNMTCDYSIPYQITCDLTIVNSPQVSNSGQVSCYPGKG